MNQSSQNQDDLTDDSGDEGKEEKPEMEIIDEGPQFD